MTKETVIQIECDHCDMTQMCGRMSELLAARKDILERRDIAMRARWEDGFRIQADRRDGGVLTFKGKMESPLSNGSGEKYGVFYLRDELKPDPEDDPQES